MRLLLDSHVVLWLLAEPERLPRRVVEEVEEETNEKLVSAATIWELEIKRASGKLRAPHDLAARVRASGFGELEIGFDHAQAAARLPAHHADPFDRVLVAQAQIHRLTLVSADPMIARYDVKMLAAA